MSLPIPLDLPPMEARSAASVPKGDNWQYEPKWDGFRCIAFRDGDDVHLQSKAGQPLARYFPEVVESVLAVKSSKFVLDGEIVVPSGAGLDFDALLQRIHPAESRVRKLAVETPAILVVFDLLADARRNLLPKPLVKRRKALDAFAKKFPSIGIRLSPATTDIAGVKGWLKEVGGALDGVMAKRLDAPYDSGGRDAMVKVKSLKTADCVVGGFRYGEGSKLVGSLLLGLYDDAGLLHHVGFMSGFKDIDRAKLTKQLEALVAAPGFTGKSPGGPSRWSTARSAQWQPLKPKLVVEVRFDHVSGGRFRHGTKLLRWRPDKKPTQCTMEQLHQVTAKLPGL